MTAPARSALVVNPALWEALAPDRERWPYVPASAGTHEPAHDRCVACGTRFRPRRVKAADRPGTVLHRGHGMCTACGKKAAR